MGPAHLAGVIYSSYRSVRLQHVLRKRTLGEAVTSVDACMDRLTFLEVPPPRRPHECSGELRGLSPPLIRGQTRWIPGNPAIPILVDPAHADRLVDQRRRRNPRGTAEGARRQSILPAI